LNHPGKIYDFREDIYLKKLINLILLVALIIATSVGCTNTTGQNTETETVPQGDTGNTETETVPTADTGKQTTLTYWVNQNTAHVKALTKQIQDYEKAYPNIKINMQAFPYSDLLQKIRTAYVGNNAPDIAQVFGTQATPFAKAGFLAEIPDGNKYISEMFESTTAALVVNGKLYGIPQEYNLENGGILVNSDLMKKAGVSVPKTWDELVQTAKKLTVYDNNNQIKQFGFDIANSDTIMFLFLSLILQQGGTYWTADKMVKFNTPEAIKAFNTMRDLITVDKVTNLSHLSAIGNLQHFDFAFKGENAMTMTGSYAIGVGKSKYDHMERFTYISMPSFTDKPPFFVAESGWGNVVSEKSKNKNEALNFVQYLAQKENSIYFNNNTGTIPPQKDVVSDPEYVKQNEIIKPYLDALEYGSFIGPVENRDFFNKQIVDGFQAVVGGKPTETVLQSIEKSINEMIVKERK
jgi:multiple sugar transport system substrate-binding protein